MKNGEVHSLAVVFWLLRPYGSGLLLSLSKSLH